MLVTGGIRGLWDGHGAICHTSSQRIGSLRGKVRGRGETVLITSRRPRSIRSRATADFDELTMIAAGSPTCRGRDERQAVAASALRCPHSTGCVAFRPSKDNIGWPARRTRCLRHGSRRCVLRLLVLAPSSRCGVLQDSSSTRSRRASRSTASLTASCP